MAECLCINLRFKGKAEAIHVFGDPLRDKYHFDAGYAIGAKARVVAAGLDQAEGAEASVEGARA